ncbi:hypothetical protein [Nocardia nova]|uniref:hypothetical protein n=1 Tax=Nocardia nova TaxID=37330 RepID=UPI0009E07BC0|nr:hypothetical protein [Nocardia nova]
MSEPHRRQRGELKAAIREYMQTLNGEPASIPEITAAIEPKLGSLPKSSVRATLQDERYFVRVERGVFKLKQADV